MKLAVNKKHSDLLVSGGRTEKTAQWGTFLTFTLHHILFRLVKLREMKWMDHVASMRQNVYKIFVGKPDGKRPLGRPRCRWEYNIIIDLTEIRWEGVDWIHLAEDRDQWLVLVNTVIWFHSRRGVS
jgi:hypothetical protein